eukprot:UN29424
MISNWDYGGEILKNYDLPVISKDITMNSAKEMKAHFEEFGFEIYNGKIYENQTDEELKELFDDVNIFMAGARRLLIGWYCGHGFIHPKSLSQTLLGVDGESLRTTFLSNRLNIREKDTILIVDCYRSTMKLNSLGRDTNPDSQLLSIYSVQSRQKINKVT